MNSVHLEKTVAIATEMCYNNAVVRNPKMQRREVHDFKRNL